MINKAKKIAELKKIRFESGDSVVTFLSQKRFEDMKTNLEEMNGNNYSKNADYSVFGNKKYNAEKLGFITVYLENDEVTYHFNSLNKFTEIINTLKE